MKAYYYFLFRLYWSFVDLSKDDHKTAIVTTGLISTLAWYFLMYTLYHLSYYFSEDPEPALASKWIVVIVLAVVFFLNYYFFIRKEVFLKMNFQKDLKGGILILAAVALLILSFVIGANRNIEKINQKSELMKNESVKD